MKIIDLTSIVNGSLAPGGPKNIWLVVRVNRSERLSFGFVAPFEQSEIESGAKEAVMAVHAIFEGN